MPIFVCLTVKSKFGRHCVYVNMAKVQTFNLAKSGSGTQIEMDDYSPFDVEESPEEIMNLINQIAYKMGIGR